MKERRKSAKPKMRWCQGLILTVITLHAGCLLAVAAGEARRNEEDKERLREVGVSTAIKCLHFYDFRQRGLVTGNCPILNACKTCLTLREEVRSSSYFEALT